MSEFSMRGRGAMKEAAADMQNRGGQSWTRMLLLQPGESVLVRFRGYIRPLPTMTEDQLRVLAPQRLRVLCRSWGVFDQGVQSGEDGQPSRVVRLAPSEVVPTLVERLMDRQGHLEPFTLVEDYVHQNQAGKQYLTCAEKWSHPGDCVTCEMRRQGDRRVQRQKLGANFSVVPLRFYHYVKAQRAGEENDFSYCSNYGYSATGDCVYCRTGDIPKQEGMKRFSVANMHTDTLFGLDDRISKKCASCGGQGAIHHVSWACARCGDILDLEGITDLERDRGVMCPCSYVGPPVEEVSCTRKCADARRSQLYDWDILIQKFGSKKTTTYGFTEQACEHAPPEVLQFRLPSWETTLAPGDTDAQSRLVGVPVNPFTGRQVAAAGPAGGATAYGSAYGGSDLGDVDVDVPF